jgi:hypothetical protein
MLFEMRLKVSWIVLWSGTGFRHRNLSARAHVTSFVSDVLEYAKNIKQELP